MNHPGEVKAGAARLRKPSEGRSGLVDFVFSLMTRGAGAPLAFAANLMLARLLGPDSYGRYMTLLSAGLLAGGLAAFGVGPVLTREIAAQQFEQQPRMVLIMFRWALKLTGLLSFGLMMITFIWLAFGPRAPMNSYLERIASVAIIPVSVWSIIATGMLAGLSQVAKSQAIGNILKNGILAVGVAFFLYFEVGIVNYVLWLQVFSYLFATLIGVLWIIRALRRRIPQKKWDQQINDDSCCLPPKKAWRKSAGRFFIGSFAILLLGRLDVIIVSAIHGSEQAGLFGAATRLAQLAGITVMVWIAWLQPRMAFTIRNTDKAQVRYLVYVGFWGSLISTTAVVLAGWYTAPFIMDFLGRGFHGSIAPFRWIILGYVALGASTPFYVFLTMAGKEKTVAIICWIQMILTLGPSLPLIARYGALGAAWAWSGGWTLASLIIIWRGLHSYRRFVLSKTH